jgi:hypothetical protein
VANADILVPRWIREGAQKAMMAEEYSQGIVMNPLEVKEVAVLKNGLPMSIDDITDDFEMLQNKIKQLEDKIITAKNIINCGLDRHTEDDKYRYFLKDAQKALKE